MKKIFFVILFSALFFSAFYKSAIAQSPLQNGCIDTAIGCIHIDTPGSFITDIIKWAIGVGGGVAFLLIIYSSFMIMTSQGDPKRLQAGQELLSSAIMGLILLIFSVTLLRIVGVDLLDLPNWR